ncbi:MAG: tetratricopeptide repeat protein [Candidatus Methanoperedens sp.]|nr:tetratricopeptide repeat protein [Candidatus Methanoperedens sp.]MCZ7406604.1 tetratricopeptide repeat protein [Candidatus Methanoperedens sp.]
MEDYNKAIELNPKYAEAYNNRGAVYIYSNEFDKAIKDYNKAIELDPKFASGYQNLAEMYILRNKHNDSLAVAQKSLEISKEIIDRVKSKFFIALSLILQGKGENEEKEFIEYCNLNKGYYLTFEFDALEIGLKDSKYSGKISKLIKLIKDNAKNTQSQF